MSSCTVRRVTWAALLVHATTLCVSLSPANSPSTAFPGSTGLSAIQQRLVQEAHTKHQKVVQQSLEGYPRPASHLSPMRELLDADFHAYDVGRGFAGPDEASLGGRGHEAFVTADKVVSVEECEALIAEAQATIDAGLAAEVAAGGVAEATHSNTGQASVSEMPRAHAWLSQALHERFYPLLASRYGGGRGGAPGHARVTAESLRLYDSLIIKYNASSELQRSQHSTTIHRDSSLVTLNVVLSPLSDYEGGGTYFEGLRGVLQAEQGHAVCHASGAQHAGRRATAGVRWVLVLFVVAETVPQQARHLHELGGRCRADGDLDAAAAAFAAALTFAPDDHQLHQSAASLHMQRGDVAAARASLSKASALYPHDGSQAAAMRLGRMLVEAGRPRAALRRYELALSRVAPADVEGAWPQLRAAAWDARVQAALCAVLCAERTQDLRAAAAAAAAAAASAGGGDGGTSAPRGRGAAAASAAEALLPEARERLRVAIDAAPGHKPLLQLLERAGGLPV